MVLFSAVGVMVIYLNVPANQQQPLPQLQVDEANTITIPSAADEISWAIAPMSGEALSGTATTGTQTPPTDTPSQPTE